MCVRGTLAMTGACRVGVQGGQRKRGTRSSADTTAARNSGGFPEEMPWHAVVALTARAFRPSCDRASVRKFPDFRQARALTFGSVARSHECNAADHAHVA